MYSLRRACQAISLARKRSRVFHNSFFIGDETVCDPSPQNGCAHENTPSYPRGASPGTSKMASRASAIRRRLRPSRSLAEREASFRSADDFRIPVGHRTVLPGPGLARWAGTPRHGSVTRPTEFRATSKWASAATCLRSGRRVTTTPARRRAESLLATRAARAGTARVLFVLEG